MVKKNICLYTGWTQLTEDTEIYSNQDPKPSSDDADSCNGSAKEETNNPKLLEPTEERPDQEGQAFRTTHNHQHKLKNPQNPAMHMSIEQDGTPAPMIEKVKLNYPSLVVKAEDIFHAAKGARKLT